MGDGELWSTGWILWVFETGGIFNLIVPHDETAGLRTAEWGNFGLVPREDWELRDDSVLLYGGLV